MRPHEVKRLAARAADAVRLTAAGHWAQVALLSPFIRAVNYHGLPPGSGPAFEAQLREYARRFHPVGEAELTQFLRGEWVPRGRPGLIITFDDGLRSQFDIAAPLLDRYGFTGWFFIPSGLLDLPVAEQRSGARRHSVMDGTEPPGDRVFMAWDEVRSLRPRHVVGCHTANHHRLSGDTPPEVLEREIAGAKRRLEQVLGEETPVFCWVGGEEHAYSRAAANAIRQAGFRLSFMTNHSPIRPGTSPFHLQRSNVEVTDPVWMARFQICGAMDLAYAAKRRRVDRLTSLATGQGKTVAASRIFL
jgi:peptidoglycan/xylan/chitin deacetylase (PgdA/CDA1 family)